MRVHGVLHQFPKEIKTVIFIFIIVLSIGSYCIKEVFQPNNVQCRNFHVLQVPLEYLEI